jgi:hypothetical protein
VVGKGREGVDGRDKHGHDELRDRTPYQRTACDIRRDQASKQPRFPGKQDRERNSCEKFSLSKERNYVYYFYRKEEISAP